MTTQQMDKAVRFYVARDARDAAQRAYDKTPGTCEAFKVAREARDAAHREYDQAWAVYSEYAEDE